MSDNPRKSLFLQNGGKTVHPRIRSSSPSSNQQVVEIDDNDNDNNLPVVEPMQVASSVILTGMVGSNSNPQSADESSRPNHQVIDLLEDDSEEGATVEKYQASAAAATPVVARTVKKSSSSQAQSRSSMGSDAELAISLDDSDEETKDLPPPRSSSRVTSLAQNVASLKALKAGTNKSSGTASPLKVQASTTEKKNNSKIATTLQGSTSIDASKSNSDDNDKIPPPSPFVKKNSTSLSPTLPSETLKLSPRSKQVPEASPRSKQVPEASPRGKQVPEASPRSKQVPENRAQHDRSSTQGLAKQDLLATSTLSTSKKRARSSNASFNHDPDSSDDEQFGGVPRRLAAAADDPPPMIVDLLDIDDDDDKGDRNSPDCIDLVADSDSDNDNDDEYNDVPRGPLIRPFAQVRSPERNKTVIEIEDSSSEDDQDEIPIAAFSSQKSSSRQKMTARKGTQRPLHFPKQQVPSRKQPDPPLTSESSIEDSSQRPHFLVGASSSLLRKSPPPEDVHTYLARTQVDASQPRDIFRQALADGSNVDVREISSIVAPPPQVQEPAAASVVALGNESILKCSKVPNPSIPASPVQPQLSSFPRGNSSLASRGLDFVGGLLSKAVGSTILHSPPEDRVSNTAGASMQTDREYQISRQGGPQPMMRGEQDKSESRQSRAPTLAPSVYTHPSSPQLSASRSSSKEAHMDGNSTKISGSAMVPPPTDISTTPQLSKTSHESKPMTDSPYVPEEYATSSLFTVGEAVEGSRMKRKREPTSRLTFDKFGSPKHGADDKTEFGSEDASSPAEAAVSFRTEEDSTASAPSETSTTDLSALTSMTIIPHLSKTTICKTTGLPIRHFCVHGFPDDYVYDFKIEARQSKIPNAGMGAFLTFIGARRLQQKTRIRATELLDARPYKELTTMRPLVAKLSDGFGMGVSLTGAHLHGPYNSTYLLPALKAANPGTGRKIKVRLANSQDVSYYPDELEAMKNPNKDERFGFLGIHHENHYRCDTKKTFASAHEGCGLIDIGRYGPFRREDRKLEKHFEFKAFLFSFEPSEWCFGVEESLDGNARIIDVTDDLTGEPHEIAKQNIPMYVNEIGHNKNYKQNVHALDKDDRAVHYFLHIIKPMKPGDSIECLVDYFKVYESVRERKGYGLANRKGVKSDEDFATAMSRNFVERTDMEETVFNLGMGEIYIILEWLDSIRSQLVEITDSFILKEDWRGVLPDSIPTSQQFVALVRFEWLAQRFRNRLEIIEAEVLEMENYPPTNAIFRQCREWIDDMKWKSCVPFIFKLNHFDELTDRRGKKVKEVFDREIIEEICFNVKDRLVRPFAECMWCPMARHLTETLSKNIYVLKHTDGEGSTHMKNKLFDLCLIHSKSAAALAFDGELANLEFDPDIPNDTSFSKNDLITFCGFQPKSPFFKDNTTTPKGLTAAVVELQAYYDAVELGLEPCLDPAQFKHRTEGNVVITGGLATERQDGFHKLIGIPRSVETIIRHSFGVNTTWYIIHQIIFVIDAFASKFLPNSRYSLETICLHLGVDVRMAKHAIERGVRIYDERRKLETESRRNKPPKRRRQKPKDRSRGSNKPAKQSPSGPPKRRVINILFWQIVWKCLKDELGWTLEHGNRQGDIYALPPGVSRGRGFKNRVDFFDSLPQIMTFIETDTRWNDRPEVVQCLQLYKQCNNLHEQLRANKSLPKFNNQEKKVEWLIEKLKA